MINETLVSSNVSYALRTVGIEIIGLKELERALAESDLGEAFEKAVQAFASTKGRIILTGIGKSGHIARKIAATLCSTGSSALYLHPGEASHGDLGAVSSEDIVFAITWSGATRELGDIVNHCTANRLPLVVATANPDEWVGAAADICMALPVVREACPNELAPTSSTTLQMVLGDALAVALIEARGFSSNSFRAVHPGGRLGAQLALLETVMGTGDAVPRVQKDASLRSATIEMSRKRYGCTAVVDDQERLVGAFTDGDLRRSIVLHDLDDCIEQHMSPRPVTADPSMRSAEALALMNENAVSVIFVTSNEKLVGIAHMHDLIKLGIG